MTIKLKIGATDDYGVSGILTITGFTQSEFEAFLGKYKALFEKSDLGHFTKWFQQNACLANGQDIHVTYL